MTSLLAVAGLALTLLASAGPFTPQADAREPEGRAQGSTLRDEDLQVAQVAYRLAIGSGALCPPTYPVTGLLLHHLPEYNAAGRREMTDAYRLDRGPGIVSVVAGSPAAEAGLRAGDVLRSVNGLVFQSPLEMTVLPSRRAWRDAVNRSETALETALAAGPARLEVERSGHPFSVIVRPTPGCPVRIRLARSRQTNAFADGRTIIVTTALLRFLNGADELAVAVAHELAHNILDHPGQLRAQKVPTGILRGIGKNASRVRATEDAADRLGIRLVAAAGYDVAAAIPFWRRYYAAFDRTPQLFRTHASLKARERLAAETIAALRAAPPPQPGNSATVRADAVE